MLNTARGGIVDEDALFDALKNRRIAGAALDCFAQEPVTTPHRFGELDNVLLAPHCIAWTNELFRDIGRAACQVMVDFPSAGKPRGVLNPEVFDRAGIPGKWKRFSSRITLNLMRRLENKVAWISGATSGIGEAAARLFAREGAKVALIGRRVAIGTAHRGRIAGRRRRSPGHRLRCQQRTRRCANPSGKPCGSLAAWTSLSTTPAWWMSSRSIEYTERQWDRVMDVNVKSMFFAVKHAIPHLRRSGRGCIVNVGSISSFVGQALTPVYTTTKHAIVGLTKSIALDYAADGIRCNCVCPGITDTPMLREHLNAQPDPDAALAARLRRVPMGVALTPHDVARTILFFSCDDSAGITGTTLVIDAGYLTAAEWETRGPTAFAETAIPRGQTMKLKLACADFAFPLLPHDRVLDLIAMLEFDGVDIGLFEGRSHLASVASIQSAREIRRGAGPETGRARPALRRRLSPDGPEFRPLTPSIIPSCPRRRRARDWFLKTLDYAAAAGAKHVTALPGVYFDERETLSLLGTLSAKNWPGAVEQARQHRLVFSVEAHIGSIAPQPPKAACAWSVTFLA